MTLLEQTIEKMIAYRKQHGYTRPITFCEHGMQIDHDCDACWCQ